MLYTDHKPLIGLFNNKEPNNLRHIRWCITISMLRIKILYEQEKRNYLADALSRIKIKDDNFNIQNNNNNKENNKFNKLININTPYITTSNKKISSFKINKKNSHLKNLKFQKVRENGGI